MQEGRGYCHETHHLHRGSAPASHAPRPQGVLRLCRPRLLFRRYDARQPRRSAADQVPPAHPGRRIAARSLDQNSGEPSALPLILAPVGLLGMQHGDGEIHACRAAQAAGIPFTQSTMSICSIEDIAGAVQKPFWFQLYVMKDRGFIKALIERAIAAKCSALVLTVDLQVIGQRHQDIKNGMTVPPEWSLSKLVDFATKPAWVSGVLQGKRRTFGNLAGHLKVSDDITSLSTWINSQFDTSLNWNDIEWIRSIWPGKLILKGILDVEDAELAAKTGAQALVVSNHGGRQLDGAPSSIEVLPEIVDAV